MILGNMILGRIRRRLRWAAHEGAGPSTEAFLPTEDGLPLITAYTRLTDIEVLDRLREHCVVERKGDQIEATWLVHEALMRMGAFDLGRITTRSGCPGSRGPRPPLRNALGYPRPAGSGRGCPRPWHIGRLGRHGHTGAPFRTVGIIPRIFPAKRHSGRLGPRVRGASHLRRS